MNKEQVKFTREMLHKKQGEKEDIFIETLGGTLSLRPLTGKEYNILSQIIVKPLSSAEVNKEDLKAGNAEDTIKVNMNYEGLIESEFIVHVKAIFYATDGEFSEEEIEGFPTGSHAEIMKAIDKISGNQKGVLEAINNFRLKR
jgi:hypothetical protein